MKQTKRIMEFAQYVSLNVMGMIGLSCYILADTFFVSKGLGTNGLAALNLAIPIYSFVNGSGLMIGMGLSLIHILRKGRNEGDGMNINEIAQMAGVSRATVSRYLNHGYVSEEKQERIRKVIEETGYKPSAQAQTLRTKRTRQVGVIIPKIHSESISRMVAGISMVLKEAGFLLLLADTENKEKEELEYLELFSQNQVDGIILIATIFTPEHKRALKRLQVPVVLLGQRLEGYSCVYQDDYHAACAVARVLLAHAKKAGCIGVDVYKRQG